MANIEVTLKRYNGTTTDELFPTTTMAQVQVSTTDTTSITDYLVTNYINTDKLGASGGVATLDSNQKLTISQLPTGIAGGLKFRGSLSANTDLDTLGDLYTNVEEGQGSYWIATADIELTATAHSVVLAPGDEGDSTFPITVEAGDWIVLSGWATDDYDFSIINNTYQNATDSASGIVTLSSATDTTGTTSKVITESVLNGLATNGELNSGANGANQTANNLAASDHIHDGRYYTETEINAFFAGTTDITGYNDDNWDTAYSEKINSTSFNTNDGVLTLTRQDNTTLTVDLDGRYVETVNAGQVDTTDGIDVTNTGTAFTISHHDTSSIADTTNTEGTVIQNATFDTYGHILTQTSVDLDGRYYTETEINNWINGTATLNSNQYVQILYGAAPTSEIAGTIIIDED